MILFVHQGDEIGGAERVLETLAAHLVRAGISVAHYCPYPGHLSEQLDARFVYPHRHRRRDVAAVLGAARFLREVVVTQRATAVVANGPRGHLYAALARVDVPIVQVVHDPVAESLISRLRSPDATVFASHRAYEESAAHVRSRQRARIIEAPIDTARIDEALEGSDVTPDPHLFVNVARVQEHKGHATLLRAFAEVARSRPDARLVCVGGASPNARAGYAAELERLAPAGVRFAGFVPDRELYPLLLSSAALVHAARHESLGLVLLEAMYLGRPVVSTAAEGPRRIIVDGQTGLLAQPEDADALAAAMLRLLREPELGDRLGAAGRERFFAEFSPDASIEAFLALLSELGVT